MPSQERLSGREAVCFTAGIKGAAFSAGVIHAYLAADRPAPKVAAGISTGALSAAALERCYRELKAGGSPPDREVRRWAWFRRYLNAITWEPLDFLWKAIPDPVDFFADKPPVSDLSASALPEELAKEEAEARRNYYRLVKLGLWLAGLRITVRDVSRTLVARVRFKEHYGYPRVQRVRFYAGFLWILAKVFLHLCFSPQFTVERQNWTGFKRFPRPLFGWAAWGASVGLCGVALGLILRVLVPGLAWLRSGFDLRWLSQVLSFFDIGRALSQLLLLLSEITPSFIRSLARYDGWLSFGSLGVFVLAVGALFRYRGGAVRHLLTELGVVRGALHRYTLHRKLFELFRTDPEDQRGPVVGNPDNPDKSGLIPSSMHLLMVAAPLQKIPELSNQQLWAGPGTPIVQALLGALAVPGVFPPLQLTKPDEMRQWLSAKSMQHPPERLDLIDGAAVRQNPLPALFAWLDDHPSVANELCGIHSSDFGIHLVYNVPTEAYEPEGGKKPPERVDIVAAALASMELSRRRDTKLECRQTNFISEIELWARTMEKAQPRFAARAGADESESSAPANQTTTGDAAVRSYTAFPIFADEIAPDTDMVFKNYLAPDREDLLKSVACGCRRSLETLYRDSLKIMADSHHSGAASNNGHERNSIDCADLLMYVAGARGDFIKKEAPGLREVCAACRKKLAYRPVRDDSIKDLPAQPFQHLNAKKARTVFVASGGVFRGAFHIGVIAAMQATGIRPNLVVGASVGSLMGGALGAISKLGGPAGWRLLGQLCFTFLHVDRKVALTKTLKNAAKQVGVRTRNINLSPAQLRRMVRRGTRSDPGYVAAGAPPALIDAISTAFLIPLEETREIASQFVAGHITRAINEFLRSVRKETLRRLDIESALMGTSLLENAARTLLGHGNAGIDLESEQPYHDDRHPEQSVSFFCTTSDLNRRRPLVLPRDSDTSLAYDFVKAGLSSSAFPVVFSPRQEAEVLPGRGATDVLFSDGGMFDNLPFIPAIELLGSVQKQWRPRLNETSYHSLQRRQSQPDLFIAAALESTGGDSGEVEDVLEIYRRAACLNVNIKLDSFRTTSDRVDRQLDYLLAVSAGKELPQGLPDFMDKAVPAAVLKIVPTDRDHLNRTFAFCSAFGLRRDVVSTSIADGCFQTLDSLTPVQTAKDPLLQRTVEAMQRDGRIRSVEPSTAKRPKTDGTHCPFFQVNGESFPCPFVVAADSYQGGDRQPASSELRGIYKACTHDHAHRVHWNSAKQTPRARAATASASISDRQ